MLSIKSCLSSARAVKLNVCSVCVQDAMRSVTKQAVREARLKEIKQELLNSEKLKVSDAAETFRETQTFPDQVSLLSLRRILRTIPETCSYSDTTKTSIPLWSNRT